MPKDKHLVVSTETHKKLLTKAKKKGMKLKNYTEQTIKRGME